MNKAKLIGKADQKDEWLRYSGLNHSEEDRWLREKIASLFDLDTPDGDEARALCIADVWLTL